MMTETTISKDQNLLTLFLTQKLDSKLDVLYQTPTFSKQNSNQSSELDFMTLNLIFGM